MKKLTPPQQRALIEIGDRLAEGRAVARRYTHRNGSEYTWIRSRYDVVERLLAEGLIGLDPSVSIPTGGGGSRSDVYMTPQGVEVLAEIHRRRGADR